MASFHALIPCSPLSTPNRTAKSLQQLSTFNNGIGAHLFSCQSHKFHGGCKFSWNFAKRFNLYASLSPNGNGEKAAAADDEFIVVNFYRFVFVKDPEGEVSRHLHFMKDRNIHGRIYLNEQGINAQYSGPSKDALSYVEWVKEDHRFSEILVQISPAINGHAFPKLKLRYKPSLVQLEEGISHLPLLDPSMRATLLTPAEWRSKLEEANKSGTSSDTVNSNFVLLDVRNGYEWDIGHFQGAQRPDVDCFRSTSFGLSETENCD